MILPKSYKDESQYEALSELLMKPRELASKTRGDKSSSLGIESCVFSDNNSHATELLRILTLGCRRNLWVLA